MQNMILNKFSSRSYNTSGDSSSKIFAPDPFINSRRKAARARQHLWRMLALAEIFGELLMLKIVYQGVAGAYSHIAAQSIYAGQD